MNVGGVQARRGSTKSAPVATLPAELGVVEVDAGVEHGDPDVPAALGHRLREGQVDELAAGSCATDAAVASVGVGSGACRDVEPARVLHRRQQPDPLDEPGRQPVVLLQDQPEVRFEAVPAARPRSRRWPAGLYSRVTQNASAGLAHDAVDARLELFAHDRLVVDEVLPVRHLEARRELAPQLHDTWCFIQPSGYASRPVECPARARVRQSSGEVQLHGPWVGSTVRWIYILP